MHTFSSVVLVLFLTWFPHALVGSSRKSHSREYEKSKRVRKENSSSFESDFAFFEDVKVALVSPLRQWDNFKLEYNDFKSYTRLQSLNNSIGCGYRRIRGDGNCFYRAFAFQILERVIEAEETAETIISNFDMKARQFLEAAGFPVEKYYKALVYTVSTMWRWVDQSAVVRSQGKNPANEIANLWGLEHPDSDAFVNLLRLVSSAYLQIHFEDKGSFLADSEIPNVGDLKTKVQYYCEHNVEKMNEECDNVVIAALAEIFGARFEIIKLCSQKDNVFDFRPGVFGQRPFTFVFSPGHYNIAYLNTLLAGPHVTEQILEMNLAQYGYVGSGLIEFKDLDLRTFANSQSLLNSYSSLAQPRTILEVNGNLSSLQRSALPKIIFNDKKALSTQGCSSASAHASSSVSNGPSSSMRDTNLPASTQTAPKSIQAAPGVFRNPHSAPPVNSPVAIQEIPKAVLVGTYSAWPRLMEEYGKCPQDFEKFDKLQNTPGIGYRIVADDGNSFYRCFAFQIIERIIGAKGSAEAYIDDINRRANRCFLAAACSNYDTLNEAIQILKNWCTKSHDIMVRIGSAVKEEWAANPSQSDTMVRFLRQLASAHLRITSNVSAQARAETIEIMGNEADDHAINALADFFGCCFDIVYLERISRKLTGNGLKVFNNKPFGFLHRGRHYDIAYYKVSIFKP